AGEDRPAHLSNHHQGALDLRAGAPADERRTRSRPLRGTILARPSPSCAYDDDRLRLPPTSSARNSKTGKKESTGRRLSQLCPPYATPSSNSSFDYRRSDARIVENGFATSGGVSKSAKVVLAALAFAPADAGRRRTGDALCDRQRVGGRADRAGDWDRRRHEHELVDLVGGAVLAEVLEIEDLAHGHAHDWNGDPVPGLVDAAFGVVRPHLAAPGVAGERGELGAGDPFQRLERKAGRVAAGTAVPAAGLEAALHLAGANDDVVAALDAHPLRPRGAVEVFAGDAIAVVERLFAERARNVEEDTAADHPVLGLLDAALLRAGRGHFAAIVAVPHAVFVKDV